MLIDEITIHAKAGNGGNGVVRWHRHKYKPKGGPAGGNGGSGGDVYVRGVTNTNQLARYVGVSEFKAGDGEDGMKSSKHGKNGDDCIIDVPVGSVIVDDTHKRRVEITDKGEIVKMLSGGRGGYGNEYFKSSTNTAPYEATNGSKGERATLSITLSLIADIGLVGLPNAGKSTLLNLLTNASSKVGAYPFTTLSPHLGMCGDLVIADIPGLIEGAHAGKGVGDKFLRHISRTKMLCFVLSLESENPKNDYYTILNELSNYNNELLNKRSIIILSKKDLVNKEKIEETVSLLDEIKKDVLVVSENDKKSIKKLKETLVLLHNES